MSARAVDRRTVPRRAVLLGAAAGVVAGTAGVIGVEADYLPGRYYLNRLLHLLPDPPPDPGIPTLATGPVVERTFRSRYRGDIATGYAVAYPPGHEPGAALPVAIVLHGTESDHRTAFTSLGLHEFLAQVVDAGATPFALASVDGDRSWWRRRADGTDTGAMVTRELLPLLETAGLRTDRLALTGWSMGGWGALRLAAHELAGQVRAVAATSTPFWRSYGAAEDGAFDSQADFDANDVRDFAARIAVPVRLTCGTDDAFYDGNEAFARDAVNHPATDFQPGGHNGAYWHATFPGQLRFLADALG